VPRERSDDLVARISALPKREGNSGRRRTFTETEGIAALKAIRSGVTATEVAKVVGCDLSALYSALGTWAIYHAKL
jgi:hypothetical protein